MTLAPGLNRPTRRRGVRDLRRQGRRAARAGPSGLQRPHSRTGLQHLRRDGQRGSDFGADDGAVPDGALETLQRHL